MFAVAAGSFDRDRTKTRLEVREWSAESRLRVWLVPAFNRLAEQFLYVWSSLDFKMPQVLIAADHKMLNRLS